MPIAYKSDKVAGTQWCPFSRVGKTSSGQYSFKTGIAGINRDVEKVYPSQTVTVFPSGANCIGSKCAKWEHENTVNGPTGLGRCGA